MIDTHGAQVVVCTDSDVCTLPWTALWFLLSAPMASTMPPVSSADAYAVAALGRALHDPPTVI